MFAAPMPNDEIAVMVEAFTNQLAAAVERSVARRVQTVVAQAIGVSVRRGPGRPPKNGGALIAAVAPAVVRPRKKPPLQLCPVPGCKNAAAPVFGMVCAQHKGIPKAKIRQYREQRRQAKEKAARKAA
jgi:hypothetical protein